MIPRANASNTQGDNIEITQPSPISLITHADPSYSLLGLKSEYASNMFDRSSDFTLAEVFAKCRKVVSDSRENGRGGVIPNFRSHQLCLLAVQDWRSIKTSTESCIQLC